LTAAPVKTRCRIHADANNLHALLISDPGLSSCQLYPAVDSRCGCTTTHLSSRAIPTTRPIR
jgi:hypothetical protein